MKPTAPIPSYGYETHYRGIAFRGWCEAVWAAAFDLLRFDWEYEPRGEKTFPDFLINGNEWIECKGGLTCKGESKDTEESPDFRRFIQTLAGSDLRDDANFCLVGRDASLWVRKLEALDLNSAMTHHYGPVISGPIQMRLLWKPGYQFDGWDKNTWPRAQAMVSNSRKTKLAREEPAR